VSSTRSCALIAAAALSLAGARGAQQQPSAPRIVIDYPTAETLFPPEFPAPLFQWRDSNDRAAAWRIDIEFAGGARRIQVKSTGERMRLREIDPECIGAVPPALTPEQAAAHTWRPDAETWSSIKQRATGHPATVIISGLDGRKVVSRGQVSIQASPDPVAAPIFYRDVPLIPVDTEKGVIKPLPNFAISLIKWRIRSVAETESRTVMERLPTCANCHSFSRDGSTFGLDVDGPQNDKGLYALIPVGKQMTIRDQDVIRWGQLREGGVVSTGGPTAKRFGFMSQVSPDGQYVITTIENPGAVSRNYSGQVARGLEDRFFNAGYKDYKFGQVFYPTRGILAWYSKVSGKLQPLPGADDPRYVQANAVWSPDGKYIVFARAEARDPYPPGRKPATYANDPNETQIQYDLYRIPFNDGKGGVAEPIAGAGSNGMSNNFAKVSPDGKWIVFVQCHNGLLMRPDSRLFIVPASGGTPRPLRANTPRMNSWHSFSPNGRWLVFSSKWPSPYTQMYLTHIDDDGNDSPPVLIENATAANRAVNIPEFVNIAPDGLAKIDAPATEFYRLFDVASEQQRKKQYDDAIATWRKALELSPDDAKAHSNLGVLLANRGKLDEAVAHYKKAVALEPDLPQGYTNLGVALARTGDSAGAIAYFEKALEFNPSDADAHSNLGAALAEVGRLDEAVRHCQTALHLRPDHWEAHGNLAMALARAGKPDQAIPHFEKALAGDPDSPVIHSNLAGALMETGRFDDAIPHFEKALAAEPDSPQLNYYLGRVLAMRERFADAAPRLEKAAASSGGEPMVLGTLAAVYAQMGRPGDALDVARRALSAAAARNDQNLVRALSSSISSYEALQRQQAPKGDGKSQQ
jgi:tetratricopeptide (TPR) repeat protein